ncbi:class IV lanthionine synthetase LanL [Streptomyces aureocirculatus]|uniref:class IV lanthionine synthetase LanL n=1 Tax=Streptomyces aureocirculatus TaxID=67275 RepID=UPI000AA35760|nr:class IV lanthionine synthetase LanL [Streptomyces aureocirculatus]
MVRPGDFWCHVLPPGGTPRLQGWKLHVSAVPLSAPQVLAKSAEVLIRGGCAFKFASSVARVAELVSQRFDRSGGGKFITAYPDGDEEQLVALAQELHRVTRGLPGPGILSDRPCFPGSLVHYRFGAFSGVRVLDNDGTRSAMLVAPDGTLVPDRRAPWFSPPSWAPRDPFSRGSGGTRPAAAGPKPVLLDGRYLVHEVIRHSFAGGVYRATDETTGAAVVIKQARPHAAATLLGTDIRDARRHEAAMLERFAASGLTPRHHGMFEQQGEVFLVQEAVSGSSLRDWVRENIRLDDTDAWGLPPETVERMALDLIGLVDLVHAEGLVLRDFNPSNVMVTDDGELRLIDLEMIVRPGQQVPRVHTPGYGAPEQVAAPGLGAAPGLEADLFSLGAALLYLVSGCDALRGEDEGATRTARERAEHWFRFLAVGNAAAARCAPVILALLDDEPGRRPSLAAVRESLAAVAGEGGAGGSGEEPVEPAHLVDGGLTRLFADAVEHLLVTMDPDSPDRLWPSARYAATADPFGVQHGAAGVLGVLSRVYEAQHEPRLIEAVRTTADWIDRRVEREPRFLPGLHFGRSGTAWALLEAGRVLGDDQLLGRAAALARKVPVTSGIPDVCHGVAGAGLTQLRFWEVTGEGDFLDRARQQAQALAAAAVRRDGRHLWPIPRGSLAATHELSHYGFAHGVAGVGAFLLAAGRATGDGSCLDLATRAAETLVSVAEVERGAAYWRVDEAGGRRRAHWCSGSSGVGTFLVRFWRETGAEACRELAHQAAVAVRRSRWHAGTTQCHGLAGDGDFLLDMAEATGDERYRDWAGELAASLYMRHVLRDGRVVVPDESGAAVLADFGTGLSGVLAFLLRLRAGGPRLWLPETFTTSQRLVTAAPDGDVADGITRR